MDSLAATLCHSLMPSSDNQSQESVEARLLKELSDQGYITNPITSMFFVRSDFRLLLSSHFVTFSHYTLHRHEFVSH